MRIALTGATGLVGRFLTAGLAAHQITTVGRRPSAGLVHHPWSLGEDVDLHGQDALIHCAFAHVPGRYRGGEGEDPQGFLRTNLDGSKRLLDAAARDGLRCVIFLSSRAVLGGYPPGTDLLESLPPAPDSLYAEAKLAVEDHLSTLPLRGISLRATGVYGPGKGHKWEQLFADFLSGQPITPRRATELHGADLAAACDLLLRSETRGPVHASDLMLDRQDLLIELKRRKNSPETPPDRAKTTPNALNCAKLASLGWHPRGWEGLVNALPQMV
jgi:nucleoside-diphosphate-sugar epimerase